MRAANSIKTSVLLAFLVFAGLCGRGASAQSALDQIRAHGELVITTDATYPPFEYKENEKSGALIGFDVELGNEIGKELGVKTRWLPLEWAAVFGALETRKCDLIMSGVTITDERKKGNAFSRPYFLSGQILVRRKGDSRITTSKDIPGKIVAVQQETTGQYAVQKMGLPKENIHRFDVLQDALMDVRNSRSDTAVGDLPALQNMLRKGYPELELTGGVFVHENVGIVARKNEPELLAALNQALDHIMVDGRYARLYQKWIQEPVTTTLIADLDRVRNQGTPVPPDVLARFQQGLPAVASSAGTASGPSGGSAFSLDLPLFGRALPALLKEGAKLTIMLTLLTLLIGVPCGLLVALARLSRFAPLRLLATVYVEVVRGTPLLMQIYVIYFVLPAIHISLPPFVSGVAALSLNAAAYISEIFRAGIESIDSGQMEAARALGMDYRCAMRWIILPQTLRRVLPPLTNEAVALLKDSSLVSVVALSELMRVGKEFATNSGSPTTIYLEVALIYLAMTLPLTYLVRQLETRWQPISRPRARKSRATAALATAEGKPTP